MAISTMSLARWFGSRGRLGFGMGSTVLLTLGPNDDEPQRQEDERAKAGAITQANQ